MQNLVSLQQSHEKVELCEEVYGYRQKSFRINSSLKCLIQRPCYQGAKHLV